MKVALSALLSVVWASAVQALYSAGSPVIQLENDLSKVLKSDAVWLVEFYAPWYVCGAWNNWWEVYPVKPVVLVQRKVTTHTPRRCGHCRNLTPEWEKAAKALKGIVRVAAIDMDKYQAAGQPYGIRGFPTIKVNTHRANKRALIPALPSHVATFLSTRAH
jgi:protein disulfide-isomerase A6